MTLEFVKCEHFTDIATELELELMKCFTETKFSKKLHNIIAKCKNSRDECYVALLKTLSTILEQEGSRNDIEDGLCSYFERLLVLSLDEDKVDKETFKHTSLYFIIIESRKLQQSRPKSKKLYNLHQLLRKIVITSIIDSIVDAALISTRAVMLKLFMYYELLDDCNAESDELIPILHDKVKAKKGKIHNKKKVNIAYVYGNIGNAFSSLKVCYAFGRTHIDLSMWAYQSCIKILSPKREKHMYDSVQKSISVVSYINTVLDSFKIVFNNQKYKFEELFGKNVDLDSLMCCIKYLMEHVFSNKEKDLSKRYLDKLFELFPEMEDDYNSIKGYIP